MQIKKNNLLLAICFFGYQILPTDASSLMQEITQVSFSAAQSTVIIDHEPDDEEKFDPAGRRIFNKAEPLTLLSRNGPFLRLPDGSLFTTTSRIACGISTDEGKTWIEYPLLDSAKFSALGANTVLTRKGTVIVVFVNHKEITPLNWDSTTKSFINPSDIKLPTYITYSKDYGRTWTEPFKIQDNWAGMNRRILETKDGHIVLSTMLVRNNPGRHCVLTYVSSDDGATWKSSNILDSTASAGTHAGLMEADIIQLSDGRLWMLIRTNWDYFYESYSSDNGLTWSAYQKTDIDASSAPSALLRLESGRIVMVWNRLYRKGENEIKRWGGGASKEFSDVEASWQRDELSLMYSDDDGKIWSSPVIIAANLTPTTMWWQNWISYPHVFERTKGVIWITTDYGDLKIAINENDLPK